MLHNRDISWLGFNFRVLREAADQSVPLFERLRFLSIFSSNLDEFFRIRYPYLISISNLNKKLQQEALINSTKDIIERIQVEINVQLEYFGELLKEQIIPLLKKNKIIFYYNETILPAHVPEIRELFLSRILSFIQPIFLSNNINKEFIPENNKLYLVASLESNDGILKHAAINIPSDKISRFFVLTPIDGYTYVIFLDDIIRENLSCIFPGLKIQNAYAIKFNRNAELRLADEFSGDVLEKIEKQLRKRDSGVPSRFLYEGNMPRNIQLFLSSAFNVKFEEMFPGDRYHNLSDLAYFPIKDKDLCYAKRKSLPLNETLDCGDIFNNLDQKDILLHLPYQSYNPVLAFFNQAAIDNSVTEIYATLYRVASDSHIVNALISASKNGKKVTVFVELKARFDEANNIKWSREMKNAGIQIIYNIPEIKVHSKIAVVKRTVAQQQVSYAILSTGNFNESTAQFYTDHVLMTSDPLIINELILFIKFLQKKNPTGSKINFEKILVSKFNMTSELEKLINVEMQKAQSGQPACIRIKVNNLEDPQFIKLLYNASQTGVKIFLLVRSVCCIMPGVPSISENIIVRRLVDRYLEHSRIFIFGENETAKVIIGSSDLMIRNLYYRYEVCVPIKDNIHKKELIDYFEIQWSDNTKLVELTPNLDQIPVVSNGEKMNAQENIYRYLAKKT